MSLHLAARHLAAQGRGPDTELVHMGKGEVQALRHLAHASGGALTTNPHTGLPEAGWLTSLLPMIAGAALAPMTAGTSLAFLGATPWATALTVGGISGLAQGSLKKGMLAGLGAFGGAGIGSALSGLGAAGAGATAGAATGAEAAGAAGAEAGATAPVVNTGALGTGTFGAEPTGHLLGSPTPLKDTFGAIGTGTYGANAPALTSVASAAPSATPYQTMWEGAKAAANNPGAFVNALGPHAARTGLMAAAPLIAGAAEPKKYKEEPTDSSRGTEYDYDPGTVSPFPSSGDGSEPRYFNPKYVARTTPRFASGGIADGYSSAESHLGSYSDGGRLLRGPGDGVSDSIPATIGGKQPARLADGEFVIPARIVSELGNGSTEAGSKQLYAMMDRIQQARRKTTGKTKVAVNTKAHKLMPA